MQVLFDIFRFVYTFRLSSSPSAVIND